jgi:hypothetical protein
VDKWLLVELANGDWSIENRDETVRSGRIMGRFPTYTAACNGKWEHDKQFALPTSNSHL